VFGLGYVGCVSAACFAKQGFAVVGVDVSRAKVDMVNAGRSTILEEGIGELVAEQVAAGRLRATTSVGDAVRDTQVSLVAVGTPSRPNGSIDLRYIERVCEQIGEALRGRDRAAGRHTVVIRSTVMPGTIDTVAIPAIERTSGLTHGDGFAVCSNPEFLREGTSIKDFYDPPFTLVGAHDPAHAEPVPALYAGIGAPVHVAAGARGGGGEVRVQLLPRPQDRLRQRGRERVQGARHRQPRGDAAVLRGPQAQHLDRVPEAGLRVRRLVPAQGPARPHLPGADARRRHADHVGHARQQPAADRPRVPMVMAAEGRRVGVLGLAFKAGTDDLRESPMVALIEMLIGKGREVSIYDPYVREANLTGRTASTSSARSRTSGR
jgi:GDP-mannose 6-dehydrogenase